MLNSIQYYAYVAITRAIRGTSKEKMYQQYYAYVAITRAIRGTSKEKIYEELDMESLQERWCSFHKTCKNNKPTYLSN